MDKHHPALVLVTDLHVTASAWGRGGVRGAGAARARRQGHLRLAAVLLLVRAARHTGGNGNGNASAFHSSMMGELFLVFH